MDLFHIIEDGYAILRSQGVFRQAKLYRRGTQVFAAFGTGYIQLMSYGGTSRPNVSWLGAEGEGVSQKGSRPPVYSGLRLAAE
jgi:hypothetical protein